MKEVTAMHQDETYVLGYTIRRLMRMVLDIHTMPDQSGDDTELELAKEIVDLTDSILGMMADADL